MIANLKLISSRDYSTEQTLTYNLGMSIKGLVKEQNTPIPCRVRLFERLSGRLINEVLTDNSGNYEFNHLTANKFFIVAHHPLNIYNAVIQDNIIPE